MTMKVCSKCGEEKELSEFYRHPQMADGHLSKCKKCTSEEQKKRRPPKVRILKEEPTSKFCKGCNTEKSVTEFYSGVKNGRKILSHKCKPCTKKNVSENYHTNRDYYQEYEKTRLSLPNRVSARRAYSKTDQGRIAMRRGRNKYNDKYPEKNVAHYLTSNAIRDGRLVREPCECCGSYPTEAHHDDYSKPLEVRWLCTRHHLELHGKQTYDF